MSLGLHPAMRRLGASALALVLVAGEPAVLQGISLSGGTAAKAAETQGARNGGAASRRLNADDLLQRAQRSLTLAAVATREAPNARSKKAGPYLKALKDSVKALRDLRKAAQSRDRRSFANRLAGAQRAMGRLAATYRLSGLDNREIRRGVEGATKTWATYLGRVGGSKGAATAESTRGNARRIAALRERLRRSDGRSGASAYERAELRRMLEALDRADAANRAAANQWLALAILNDIFGWYGGYYDTLIVYDPSLIQYYQDDYVYWTDVQTYYETQYVSYYEGYSFTSYTEVVTVEETSTVEFSREEEVLIEENFSSTEQEVETAYSQSESFSAIETATEDVAREAREASVEDPADTPDPEVDQAAVLNEDAPAVEPAEALPLVEETATEPAPQDAGPDAAAPAEEESAPAEAPSTEPDAASQEAPSGEAAPEQGAPDATTGGDAAEPQPAPEEPAQEDSTPEEAAPDEAVPAESAPDEAAPEDAAPEEPAPEEAAPEEPAPEEEAPADDDSAAAEPAPSESASAAEAETAVEEPAAEPEPAVEEQAEPAPEEAAPEPAYEEAAPEPASEEAAPEPEPEPAYEEAAPVDEGGGEEG